MNMNKIKVNNPILFLSSIFAIGFGASGILMMLFGWPFMVLGLISLILVYIWIGFNKNIEFKTI